MRGKKASGPCRAKGGGVFYAGGESETAKESKDKSDDFKHGGKVKGKAGHKRLDKRARGGAVGKGALSAAHALSQPKGGAPAGNDEKPSSADEG